MLEPALVRLSSLRGPGGFVRDIACTTPAAMLTLRLSRWKKRTADILDCRSKRDAMIAVR
jgi:hypothetical protein